VVEYLFGLLGDHDVDMETWFCLWFWLAVWVIQAVCFGSIFRKAGYSIWLGLLMLVPLVDLVMLVWFSSATWPLEMGYTSRGKSTKVDTVWKLKMDLRKAATMEKQGRFEDAIRQWEEVAEQAGEGQPNASLARERIRQLQAKIGGPAEPNDASDRGGR